MNINGTSSKEVLKEKVKNVRHFCALLQRLFRFSSHLKGWVILLLALSILSVLLILANSHGLRLLISGATRRDWGQAWLGFIFCAGASLANVFLEISHYVSGLYTGKLTMHLRNVVNERLQFLPLELSRERKAGDISQLTVNDCSQAAGLAASSLTNMLIQPLSSISTIVYLGITISWPITLLAFTLAMTSFVGPMIFGRKLAMISKAKREDEARLSAYLRDILGGLECLKAWCAERTCLMRIGIISKRVRDLSNQEEIVSQKEEIMQATLSKSLCSFSILLCASIMAFRGDIDPGDLAAYAMLSTLMFTPLFTFTRMLKHVLIHMGSIDRIFKVIEDNRKEDLGPLIGYHPMQESDVGYSIDFQDIHLDYGEGQISAIKGVSLSLARGETHVITGPSGSGKSTLLAVLLGLYPPQKGSVTLNGQDSRDIPLAELRSKISIVTQDPFLFDMSIRENILMVRPDASEIELQRVMDSAHIREFVENMPEGLDTRIHQQGSRLSGGQRQRISIARAMIKDSPILLLDEATAALDMSTEVHVLDALQSLIKGRTTIVVTHRLNVIKWADKISVIENGLLSATGSHQELLQKNAFYRDITEHQELS